MLLFVAAGVGIVVGGASALKVAQLASGGQAVALMMGGVEVPGTTTDARQKRLLHVVEEMALAAGVPVPPSMFCRNPASMPSRPATPRAMPWSLSPRAVSTT